MVKLQDLLGVGEQIGAFGHMMIREDTDLPFDESYVDTFLDEVVVGNIEHFVWRYHQALLNRACRLECKAISERLARTLGLH